MPDRRSSPTGRVLPIIRNVRARWRLRMAVRGLSLVLAAGFAAFLLSAFGLEAARFSPLAVTTLRITAWAVVLAVAVAFVQGGSQALSRSLYGAMTPKAKAAEFFGFFNIMGKFSAILGPVLFAAMGRLFGQSRYSIVSLIVFFVVGIVLLTFVDEGEGIRVARQEDARAAA